MEKPHIIHRSTAVVAIAQRKSDDTYHHGQLIFIGGDSSFMSRIISLEQARAALDFRIKEFHDRIYPEDYKRYQARPELWQPPHKINTSILEDIATMNAIIEHGYPTSRRHIRSTKLYQHHREKVFRLEERWGKEKRYLAIYDATHPTRGSNE